jgi:hypothetical protein
MFARKKSTLAAFAIACVVGSTASAQAVSIYGSSQFTGDDTRFFLLGATVSPSGLGWKPFVGVTANQLNVDADAGTSLSRTAFVPRVGLVNVMSEQSVSFSVGYAFADKDFDTPVLVPGETGSGVVGGFGWNYWNADRRAAQYLASYNFGTNFLWNRLRGSMPLAESSPLWVGAEGALMGNTDSDVGNPSVWLAQLGPTAEWRFSNRFRLGGSAGFQFGVSNASGSTWYAGLEFLWLPTAN